MLRLQRAGCRRVVHAGLAVMSLVRSAVQPSAVSRAPVVRPAESRALPRRAGCGRAGHRVDRAGPAAAYPARVEAWRPAGLSRGRRRSLRTRGRWRCRRRGGAGGAAGAAGALHAAARAALRGVPALRAAVAVQPEVERPVAAARRAARRRCSSGGGAERPGEVAAQRPAAERQAGAVAQRLAADAAGLGGGAAAGGGAGRLCGRWSGWRRRRRLLLRLRSLRHLERRAERLGNGAGRQRSDRQQRGADSSSDVTFKRRLMSLQLQWMTSFRVLRMCVQSRAAQASCRRYCRHDANPITPRQTIGSEILRK